MQFSKNVKITIGIMCLTGVCALSSLVGCSGNHGTNKKTETTNKVANETTGEVLNAGMMKLEDDIFGNESYEQDTYKTVTGEEVKSDDERVVFYNATGYITPDAWKEKGIMANSDGTDLNISFFSTLFFEEINAMTEEEAASVTPEEFEGRGVSFGKLFYREGKGDDTEASEYGKKSGFEICERVGTYAGNTYYIAYSNEKTREDFPGLKDEEYKEYEELTGEIKNLKEHILVFKPMMDSIAKGFANFKAEDLEGNEITQDIFNQYDLTMINVWATWCGSCLAEMPDLVKLHNGLNENVNMISICIDATENKETAQKIMKTENAKFTTLMDNEQLKESILNNLGAVPTSIFVDKEGNVVGKMVEGARSLEEYESIIEDKLTELQNQ